MALRFLGSAGFGRGLGQGLGPAGVQKLNWLNCSLWMCCSGTPVLMSEAIAASAIGPGPHR